MKRTLLSTTSSLVLSAMVLMGASGAAHAATLSEAGQLVMEQPYDDSTGLNPTNTLTPKKQPAPQPMPIDPVNPTVSVVKPVVANPLVPANKPKKAVAYLSEDGNTFYDRNGNAYHKDGNIFYDHSGKKNNLTVDNKGRIRDAKGRVLGSVTPPKAPIKPIASTPNTRAPLKPVTKQPTNPVAANPYKPISSVPPVSEKLPQPIVSNNPTPVTIELPAEGTVKKLANGFMVDSKGVIRNPNGVTIAFVKDDGTFTDANGGAVTNTEASAIKGLFLATTQTQSSTSDVAKDDRLDSSYGSTDRNTVTVPQNVGFRPNQTRPTAPQALQLFFGSDLDTKLQDLIGGNDVSPARAKRTEWERAYTSLDKNNLKAIEGWRKNIQDILQGKPGTLYAGREFTSHNPPPEFWVKILTEEAVGKVLPARVATDDAAISAASGKNANSLTMPTTTPPKPAGSSTEKAPVVAPPIVVYGGGDGGGGGTKIGDYGSVSHY